MPRLRSSPFNDDACSGSTSRTEKALANGVGVNVSEVIHAMLSEIIDAPRERARSPMRRARMIAGSGS